MYSSVSPMTLKINTRVIPTTASISFISSKSDSSFRWRPDVSNRMMSYLKMIALCSTGRARGEYKCKKVSNNNNSHYSLQVSPRFLLVSPKLIHSLISHVHSIDLSVRPIERAPQPRCILLELIECTGTKRIPTDHSNSPTLTLVEMSKFCYCGRFSSTLRKWDV